MELEKSVTPLVARVHLQLGWRLFVARCARAGRSATDFSTFRQRMAVADWVRSFSWDAFVTPTFGREVSERWARLAVMRWLRRQGRQAFAVLSYERGSVGQLVHCHGLIGGLHRSSPKHPTPLAMTMLAGSWPHGLLAVDPYRAALDHRSTASGASWYLTKSGADALTVIGDPILYQPRKRSGQGRVR